MQEWLLETHTEIKICVNTLTITPSNVIFADSVRDVRMAVLAELCKSLL
jgi:hypothetical protein